MTQVKICGITNLEDALVVVEAGADLLGFIFYEPSPRYVRPEMVKEIVSGVKCRLMGDGRRETHSASSGQAGDRGREMVHSGLRSSVPGLTFVGVFVNESLDTVAHTLDFCNLDAAQLHGEESPEFVSHFAGRAFKALRPQSYEEAKTLIENYLPCSPAPSLPCLLLDAYHPNLYGGTSHVADWEMAASIARRYPIMLAGSLTPENVAEAVRAVRPWGVDVSSGVEREKGKKDHEKVRGLVEAVKNIKRKA